MGNDKTANRAPFALACAIIAAMSVATDDKPIVPKNNITINNQILSIETPINTIKIGTIKISKTTNKETLNIHLPKKMEFGVVTNLRVSAVFCSSSLTKICDSPDIDEKKSIIHNKGERTLVCKCIGPIEKLIAVNVVMANKKIALTA